MAPLPGQAEDPKRLFAIIAAFLAVLAGVVALAIWASSGLAGTEMSWNGIAAMVIGIVLSLALGGGLMALVFFSSRHGYDERAHQQDHPPAH